MELVLSLVTLIVVIAVIWMFRKVFKDWADRAHEVSTVTSMEVKKSSVERMAKITVADEVLEKAVANKTALDAINIL